jgi:hypothetical protein
VDDDLTLDDMTNHEAMLWRQLAEPDDDPLQQEPPASGPPSATSEEMEEDEAGELPEAVPSNVEVESWTLLTRNQRRRRS